MTITSNYIVGYVIIIVFELVESKVYEKLDE